MPLRTRLSWRRWRGSPPRIKPDVPFGRRGFLSAESQRLVPPQVVGEHRASASIRSEVLFFIVLHVDVHANGWLVVVLRLLYPTTVSNYTGGGV